jgi:hypothetical protein
MSSHPGLSVLGLIRVAQHMSLALGPMLTVTFVTLAMVGTTTACSLGASGVDCGLCVATGGRERGEARGR